jgi:hypothetical protein
MSSEQQISPHSLLLQTQLSKVTATIITIILSIVIILCMVGNRYKTELVARSMWFHQAILEASRYRTAGSLARNMWFNQGRE